MAVERGDKVKSFSLANSEGKEVSLIDLTDERKLVLFFFPLAFSDVSTEELSTIRNNMKFYDALHANVVAVSVDSFFTLKEFKKANNLNFSLLSDFNKEVSEQLGVLNENYMGMKGVSKRAVFVINKNLEVEYSEITEDPQRLPDFRALQKALQ